MKNIANTYIDALLADAAYVNLTPGMSVNDMVGDLNKSMTPTLAKFIADNFEVASSINSPDIPLLGSGFDATVWRGRTGSEFAGQVFVSMRGTEWPGVDVWGADVDLTTNAAARTQIIDMANWWLRETAPAGSQAKQIKWDPLRAKPGSLIEVEPGIVLGDAVAGTGNLVGVTSVQVNGHSLGGHLASAFALVFGGGDLGTSTAGSVRIESIETFNSAGFNGDQAQFFFTQIQGLLGTGMPFFSEIRRRQSNYFADNGMELAANDWWSTQLGERVGLGQEEGTGPSNHSMYKLTDLLALGAALNKLDGNMTIDTLNVLAARGSSQPAGSIEGIFDALRRALEGPSITASAIGDASDSAPTRVQFHAALVKFNEDHENLAGQLTIEASSPELQSQARHDFAALVALQDLSPIVVRGLLTEVWQSTRAEDYAAWEADWYQPTPTNFTQQWMADRAAMLGYVVQANEQDIEGPLNIPSATGMHYEDLASGKVIDIGLANNVVEKRQTIFGDGTANQLTGKKLADHLYGGAGMDTLVGLGGDDYLEGGADDDTLEGSAGTDTLVGGAGVDTYRFQGDWGVDTIEDSDGLGTIEVNGQTLAGGRLVSANAWESADKQWRYALTEQDDLVVTHTSQAGRIVVRGWSRMQGKEGFAIGFEASSACWISARTETIRKAKAGAPWLA